jgi:hypothetical protein
MSGGEKYYEIGVEVTRLIYKPVLRIHRVTVEQMSILEPALVETLAQTCMEIVKEGYYWTTRRKLSSSRNQKVTPSVLCKAPKADGACELAFNRVGVCRCKQTFPVWRGVN